VPSKRPNGILIGTILVVLVGALIFVQSQFMAPSDEDEHAHDEAPAPSLNTPGHTPTVEELQNQLKGTGQGPTVPQTGPTPENGPAPVKVN